MISLGAKASTNKFAIVQCVRYPDAQTPNRLSHSYRSVPRTLSSHVASASRDRRWVIGKSRPRQPSHVWNLHEGPMLFRFPLRSSMLKKIRTHVTVLSLRVKLSLTFLNHVNAIPLVLVFSSLAFLAVDTMHQHSIAWSHSPESTCAFATDSDLVVTTISWFGSSKESFHILEAVRRVWCHVFCL